MNPFEIIKPAIENPKLLHDEQFTSNWKSEYFSMYFFFQTALEKHGNKYDYSKVTYRSMLDKVTIICPIHGEFKQKKEIHTRGSGCQKCGKNRITKTTEEFIEDARKKHGESFDYSKVKYENCRKHVIIICNTCKHEFLQSPANHLE